MLVNPGPDSYAELRASPRDRKTTMPTPPTDWEDTLLSVIKRFSSAAVAFSGGVDSAVVAAATFRALGENALAITGDSPSVPRKEIDNAKKVASEIGIRHVVLGTQEFTQTDYLRNDGSRCYFCKSELYSQIQAVQPQYGFDTIFSGANKDDLGDYRPGLVAAKEKGIVHPLIEAGMGKAQVRELAQFWGLPIWDKPASPCLSSRIAPHLEVTSERTAKVEKAEDFLHSLGFPVCRVRYFPGDLAKIEVPLDLLANLLSHKVQVEEELLKIGFSKVEIDPKGFRSGNLNELIPLNHKKQFSLSPTV